MKNIIYIILLLTLSFSYAQNNEQQKEEQRIQKIKNELTALSASNTGLTENLKTEIDVLNITLPNFLKAVANVHKLNISASEALNQISISPSFPDVTVTNLLVFLCKEYQLTIDFTGNILAVKTYQNIEKPKERVIPISYDPSSNNLSIDVKGDKLYDVFKSALNDQKSGIRTSLVSFSSLDK